MFLLLLLLPSLVAAAPNGLARIPTRGWSSWNRFRRNITEDLFRDTADAIVDLGFARLGFTHVSIDGGWWEGVDTGTVVRNASGFIQVDASRFPSRSFAPLASYMHARGLLWGHYTDAGTHACNGDTPMSEGFEVQDAALFASWGTDMLKLDACSVVSQSAEATVQKWAALLNASGRRILFSNCRNGCRTDANTPPGDVWAPWCSALANTWRTGADINATWASMTRNIDSARGASAGGMHERDSGPGAWSDPDSLEVGLGEFAWDATRPAQSLALNRAHYALWCITSAPLIIGMDLRPAALPQKELIEMLQNERALDINAAFAGAAGAWHSAGAVAGTELWRKPLPGHAAAVALFNRDAPSAADITITYSSLIPFLPVGAKACNVTDVWSGSQSRATGGSYTAVGVLPRAIVFVTLDGCA